MRKDRACPCSAGPMMQGGVPMMQSGWPMMPGVYPGMPGPSFDTQVSNNTSNLEERINNLERRVSNLESSLHDTTFNNNYSNTSYQMMYKDPLSVSCIFSLFLVFLS